MKNISKIYIIVIMNIIISEKYFRPTEVDTLLGNPNKAKQLLGWNPSQTPFTTLVKKMVQSDLEYIDTRRFSRYE